MTVMTKRDREQLAQVAKMRARVAKANVEQRELVLRAQVEDELQAVFDVENEQAHHAETIAHDVAQRANDDLKEKLDAALIPEQFRPALVVVKVDPLYAATHESIASRRGALRMLAASRIRSLGAAARVEVDRQCADTVTALITGGLSGDEAQGFLDAMPTIDDLMLAPSIAELESVHDEQRRTVRDRRELGRGGDLL